VKPIGLFLLLIFFLFPWGVFSQDIYIPETGPVKTGGEASHRGELIRRLSEAGIPFEVRPLFTEYGGFGSSVYVDISPETETEGGLFILAVPLSSGENSEAGLPYGLKTALALIQKARERNLTRKILVAFLGDEQSRLPPDQRRNAHTGLEDLLARQGNPENTALVYADFYAPPEKLVIHHGGHRNLTPLNLLQPIPGLCDFYKAPFTFAVKSNELYKLGFVDGPLALRSSLAAGIPSWYLGGTRDDPGEAPEKSIPAELLGELLLEYGCSLNFLTENLDYHYLIFQNFGKTVFFPELTTVIILWSFNALGLLIFLIYSIVLRKALIIQWKIFFRYFPVILILFAVLFLTLQGSELFFGLLLNGFFLPWDKTYYGGIFFILATALILFSLIDPLFDRLKIPRKANFYGNAAIILTILGNLIAMFLDITFIPVFIWAFLFTVLAAFIPFSPPLYGISFIIPLQTAAILITSMEGANAGFPVLNYSNRVWLILFIAVTSFPSVLIFKRASVLSRGQKKRQPRFLKPVSQFILLAACMGALTLYVYNRSKDPAITPVRRVIADTPDNPAVLAVTLTDRSFLTRRILEMTIYAPAEPVRFDLYLDSESGPQPVYAAPMPFSIKETENSPRKSTLEFILGENPPNPFTTNMVLPLNFSGSLRVEALYTRYDPSLDTGPPPEGDDYVLRVTRTIPIRPVTGQRVTSESP
jgi:hypothetical protein